MEKQRSSILWLLSKAFNHEIPDEIREPYYHDDDDQLQLKPPIIIGLANCELYSQALANIYADSSYHQISHHEILQLLYRKRIQTKYNEQPVTPTVLFQDSPLRINAHMVIIEGIMVLFTREVLVPEKVVEVVSRFIEIDEQDLPADAEEAALYWLNNCSIRMRQRINDELVQINARDGKMPPIPTLPIIDDVFDLSDGCNIAILLSFYCPEYLNWTSICLNETMSMEDSFYNLELIQLFCQKQLPYNVFFLSLEDFLYLDQPIKPNVLALIADLLYMFEINPAPGVRRPGTHEELGFFDDYGDIDVPNVVDSEPFSLNSMDQSRARVDQWSDANGQFRLLNRFSDEEPMGEELLPRVIDDQRRRSVSNSIAGSVYDYERQVLQRQENLDEKPSFQYQSMDYAGEELSINNVSLQSKNARSVNESDSNLAHYFSKIGEAPVNGQSKKNSLVSTNFANVNANSDNFSENGSLIDHSSSSEGGVGGGINISYKSKSEKIKSEHEKVEKFKTWSRDRTGEVVCQQVSSSLNRVEQNASDGVDEREKMKSLPPVTTAPAVAVKNGTETNDVDNVIAAQMLNVRLRLEEKRKIIEQDRKAQEDLWKTQRQDIGKEAFLRVVKSGKKEQVANDTTSQSSDRDEIVEINGCKSEPQLEERINENPSKTIEVTGVKVKDVGKGFFISFGDDNLPKLRPPPLRPKVMKAMIRQKLKEPVAELREKRLSEDRSIGDARDPLLTHMNEYRSIENGGDRSIEKQSKSIEKAEFRLKPEIKPTEKPQKQENSPPNAMKNENVKEEPMETKETSGEGGDELSSLMRSKSSNVVGFTVGTELEKQDPVSELEMAQRKEILMMQSLRRRANQEAKRIAQERELDRRREQENQRKELIERKKEEERQRRQAILEQHRLRKMQEEAEKNGGISVGFTAATREKSGSQLTLHKAGTLRQRPGSGGTLKPRPKSLHVSASNMHEYASLSQKTSRDTDDIDSQYSAFSGGVAGRLTSRPTSAMSSNNGLAAKRLPSPTSRMPSLPPTLMCGRYKTSGGGAGSDGASDAGSMFSDYTGPKLFVKPASKSNRGILLNAINAVLAGAVNSNMKKKVLEEINNSDSKHFLILFRGAGMQFRAIYSYNPDTEEVVKLHGNGPKLVTDEMFDKFYKYNCGGRNFNEVQTKHLTVTIDAFTIHNHLWSVRRPVSMRREEF